MLLAIWLLPRIWRALKFIVHKIRNWFSDDEETPDPTVTAAARKLGIDAVAESHKELPRQ